MGGDCPDPVQRRRQDPELRGSGHWSAASQRFHPKGSTPESQAGRAGQGEPGRESWAGRAGRCHSPCRRQGPFRSHYTEHRRDVSITTHPLAVYSLLSSCLRPMLITEGCPQKSDFENSYKIDSASLSGTQCQEIYPLPGEKKEGSKF